MRYTHLKGAILAGLNPMGDQGVSAGGIEEVLRTLSTNLVNLPDPGEVRKLLDEMLSEGLVLEKYAGLFALTSEGHFMANVMQARARGDIR